MCTQSWPFPLRRHGLDLKQEPCELCVIEKATMAHINDIIKRANQWIHGANEEAKNSKQQAEKFHRGSQMCHSVKVTPCLFYPPGVSSCAGCLTERDSQSRPVSMCLFSCWTDDSLRCLHLISCWLTVPPWPQGVSTWVTHTDTHTHALTTPFRRDAAPSAAAASRGKWEWDQRRRLRTCCHLGGMNRTMPCVCARVSRVTWWLPPAAL